MEPKDNCDRKPLLTKQQWSRIPQKAKNQGAEKIENFFQFKRIVRFDSDWFQVYLLYWARKGLSPDQMSELRKLGENRSESVETGSNRMAIGSLLG
ncbi:hypothetical protein K440DRAFT_620869 [Wilcoxina mikolae CBS 423.85]|nr:hypothetical protein K440DRAFT_620869 [Wilcoxina mikolae CBS 423.85]